MTSLQFYLLFVLLPNMSDTICLVGFLAGVGSVVFLFGWFVAVDNGEEEAIPFAKCWTKCGALIFLIACAVSMFFPTTKQMGAMVAIPYLANIKNIDKVPNAIVTKLLDVLKEKEPEKKHGN